MLVMDKIEEEVNNAVAVIKNGARSEKNLISAGSVARKKALKDLKSPDAEGNKNA
jgi:hypothetical protein